jgi:hypothetical protein
MNKKQVVSSLLVAIAFGTAWAVRGKFGHEQGAAWAGGIGALAFLLVAKRQDWYDRVFQIMLASAIGWGIGGVISYGMVVGYGRGSDFINVYYGISMLFVIGALYGVLGGGLFALSLADTGATRIKWHVLFVEMVAMALLTYGLLINELEWLMTPPRSELWAACLGASLALIWHTIRIGELRVLKIALWSGIGAGFGFASGNALQVIGSSFSIPVNLWNVMEYSIGFWGGLGMTYATLTSSWPAAVETPSRNLTFLPLLLVMLFIPFVVWQQSFIPEKLSSLAELGANTYWITAVRVLSITLILAMSVYAFLKHYRIAEVERSRTFKDIRTTFVLYSGVYIILSFLVTGLTIHPVEQYLYVLNTIVFLFAINTEAPSISDNREDRLTPLKAFVVLLIVLALAGMVMILSHDELKGAQIRFEL